MFKFQKFHFRTEKFAKSGFIHHRIVVTCKNVHCVGLYQAQRWRNRSVRESRTPLADRNSECGDPLLSRASNI